MKTMISLWALALTLVLSGCVTPLPTPPMVIDETGWQTYRADSGYEIQYPLATYSMRDGLSGPDVLYPGVKVVEPNDSFYYQEPRAQTYRLSIAVSENRDGLTLDDAEQLLARSQLLAYDPALLAEATIEAYTLDGTPAVRVNDLAAGPNGIATQIVALNGPFVYELLAEPHFLTGNQAAPWVQPAPSPDNRQLLDAIIDTFRFTGDDEPMPAVGGATLGEPVLTWQGYTEMGDGDPTRCKQMAIDADGNVELGLCDGPAESRSLGGNQEWTEIQTRFAPFTLDAVSDSVAFGGVGDLAGPAWQRALLAWTHFTYGELVIGRTSAAARTAVSWYLGEASGQSGICNHLTVLVYGYAYAEQASCQGGGTVQNRVGGWLTSAEMEAFDALLYRRGPLYEGDNYFSGLGDQPWNDGDSIAVEEWAQQVYARLVDTTAAHSPDCAAAFIQVRALTADAIHEALHDFTWPEPGEPVLLGWDPALWDVIVHHLVDAGARYLNECANVGPAGEPTTAALAELAELSRVVPHLEVTIPGEGDFLPLDLVVAETVTPAAQLLDIDRDGRGEVLLHTQVGYFDGEQILFGVRGGVSIVYVAGDAGWQGHLIWPVNHYVPRANDYLEYAPFRAEQAAEQAHWNAAQALIDDPAPQVESLNLTDTDGNAYLAVSHVRRTPVDDIRELTVLRWRPQGPEAALHIMLDNWCVSAEWEIRSDGAIVVPALPEPFPHCQGTYDEQTFVLEDGRFVAQP